MRILIVGRGCVNTFPAPGIYFIDGEVYNPRTGFEKESHLS